MKKDVVKNVFMLFLVLSLFWLSFYIHKQMGHASIISASRQANVVARLANEAVANDLDQIRKTMLSLTKNPDINNFKVEYFFSELISNKADSFLSCLDYFEIPIALFYHYSYYEYKNLEHWLNIFASFIRKIIHETPFLSSFIRILDFELSLVERVCFDTHKTKDARSLIQDTKDILLVVVDFFKKHALQMDQLFLFETMALADAWNTQNVLAEAVTDINHIRGLAVKNTNGQIRAQIQDIDGVSFEESNSDIETFLEGKLFYSGAMTTASSLLVPTWRVSVPIRDSKRKILGCLAAIVDLSFMLDYAKIVSDTSTNLYFFDSENRFVCGADKGLYYGNMPIKNELASFSESVLISGKKLKFANFDNKLFVFSGIQLSGEKIRFLPQCSVVSFVDVGHFDYNSSTIKNIYIILLVSLGLLIMFFSINNLVYLAQGRSKNE